MASLEVAMSERPPVGVGVGPYGLSESSTQIGGTTDSAAASDLFDGRIRCVD
jgi:hypothetical protein